MVLKSKFVREVAGALLAGALLFALPAHSQQLQAPEARLIVIGEGTVKVTPDYAQVVCGVTTRAKTVKEASDANAKTMTAATSTLLASGVAERDIRTSRFSLRPVFVPQEPPAEPKLTGYSVSNEVTVNIRALDKVGDILDHLITAGVTTVTSISFLVSDQSKALDEARVAAIADARRKAEIYARASQLRLGDVAWVTEDSGLAPPVAMRAQAASAPAAASVPIAPGEGTLRVRVTVGFGVVH